MGTEQAAFNGEMGIKPRDDMGEYSSSAGILTDEQVTNIWWRESDPGWPVYLRRSWLDRLLGRYPRG